MLQRLNAPGRPPTTIDYGGGPYGDTDVRLIQFGRSREPIGARSVADASADHVKPEGLALLAPRYQRRYDGTERERNRMAARAYRARQRMAS